MSIDHFYKFIDRAVIDPILQMSWVDFLHKYPWRRKALNELLAFAVDPEPDTNAVSGILAERTLRWTMKRSAPPYFFMYTVISHVPRLRKRCPEIWPENLHEIAVLEATAVNAFLRGRINKQTLWAIYNIDGAEDPRGWLQLSRTELKRVKDATSSVSLQKPIFPWQANNCLGDGYLTDGYRCLRLADTKRFIVFLTQAWQENWTVPRLREDVREQLAIVDNAIPHFRDFDLPQKLVACIRDTRLDRPCVLRYFG